jgi:hypothetical protein
MLPRVSATVAIPKPDLQQVFDNLRGSRLRLIGPTVVDGAIALGEIERTEQLPIGWSDEQQPGRYRAKHGAKKTYFAFNVGPHSWCARTTGRAGVVRCRGFDRVRRRRRQLSCSGNHSPHNAPFAGSAGEARRRHLRARLERRGSDRSCGRPSPAHPARVPDRYRGRPDDGRSSPVARGGARRRLLRGALRRAPPTRRAGGEGNRGVERRASMNEGPRTRAGRGPPAPCRPARGLPARATAAGSRRSGRLGGGGPALSDASRPDARTFLR